MRLFNEGEFNFVFTEEFLVEFKLLEFFVLRVFLREIRVAAGSMLIFNPIFRDLERGWLFFDTLRTTILLDFGVLFSIFSSVMLESL